MLRFTRGFWLILAVLILFGASSGQAITFFIDSFDTCSPQQVVNFTDGTTADDANDGCGAGAIGGARELAVTIIDGGFPDLLIGGRATVLFDNEPMSGVLNVSTDSGVQAEYLVRWDGNADGEQSYALGADLSRCGSLKFNVVEVDLEFLVKLTLCNSDGTQCVTDEFIKPASNDPFSFSHPLTSFSAFLSNVGSISMVFTAPLATPDTEIDFRLDSIEAECEEEEDGRGRVTPTGTTCDQFVDFAIDGFGDDPGNDGDFADGGFNYTVKNGNISNVSSPGAAFYFTTFTAPADSFTVKVVQNASVGSGQYELKLTTLQVSEVVGTAPNATCSTLIGNLDFTDATDPAVPLNIPGIAGKQLVLRWRIDPKSVQGQPDPGATYTLTFESMINAGPTFNSDSVDMIRTP